MTCYSFFVGKFMLANAQPKAIFPRVLDDGSGIETEPGTLRCNDSELLNASVDVTDARHSRV